MIFSLNEIEREFKRSGYVDFESYLHNHFYPVYDHILNFVGYRRSGDYEERHSGVY